MITLTHRGYIKRIPLNAYLGQHRGGRGVTALTTRSEDFVDHLFVTTTLHASAVLHQQGQGLPPAGVRPAGAQPPGQGHRPSQPASLRRGRGRSRAVIPLREFCDNHFIFMATRRGVVKKGRLLDYDSARRDGIIAIRLEERGH